MMKRFILTSLFFLIASIVAAVTLFLYVSKTIPESSEIDNQSISNEDQASIGPAASSEESQTKPNQLSEGQTERLREFGIESDGLTITPEMIACAEDAIGAVRAEEIAGGEEPTLLEVGKLLPCLGA